MNITEIRVSHVDGADDRLRAFCSVTFDNAFVVRDLKIIESTNGLFVAMPSREVTVHCHRCGSKNGLRASYCNECGAQKSKTAENQGAVGEKQYFDVAHPINARCREMIQEQVISQYRLEREARKK